MGLVCQYTGTACHFYMESLLNAMGQVKQWQEVRLTCHRDGARYVAGHTGLVFYRGQAMGIPGSAYRIRTGDLLLEREVS